MILYSRGKFSFSIGFMRHMNFALWFYPFDFRCGVYVPGFTCTIGWNRRF